MTFATLSRSFRPAIALVRPVARPTAATTPTQRRTVAAITSPVADLSPVVASRVAALRARYVQITPSERAKFMAFVARTQIKLTDSRHLVCAVTEYPEEDEAMQLLRNDQQRLATLGRTLIRSDAMELFFARYPNAEPLELASMANCLVSSRTLVAVGQLIGLREVMRTVGGKSPELGAEHMALMCAAVVGAVHADQGRAASTAFIAKFFLSREVDEQAHVSFRGSLQKQVQTLVQRAGFKEGASARIIKETGRMSDQPVFLIGIFCGDVEIGRAYGGSVKMATTLAYKAVVQNFQLQRI